MNYYIKIRKSDDIVVDYIESETHPTIDADHYYVCKRYVFSPSYTEASWKHLGDHLFELQSSSPQNEIDVVIKRSDIQTLNAYHHSIDALRVVSYQAGGMYARCPVYFTTGDVNSLDYSNAFPFVQWEMAYSNGVTEVLFKPLISYYISGGVLEFEELTNPSTKPIVNVIAGPGTPYQWYFVANEKIKKAEQVLDVQSTYKYMKYDVNMLARNQIKLTIEHDLSDQFDFYYLLQVHFDV